jgi:hypothetical protein
VLRRTLAAFGNHINPAMMEDFSRIAAQALGWDEGRRQDELAQAWQLLRERHGVACHGRVTGMAGSAAPSRLDTTPGRIEEESR